MGSFQSKNAGPQIRSPRHSSIGGRLHIDSPSLSSRMGRAGSMSRLSSTSPGRNNSMKISSSVGRLPIGGSPGAVAGAAATAGSGKLSEISPLIPPTKPSPLPDSSRLLSASSKSMEDAGAAAAAAVSPPLAVWIGPALACAMSYALYNIFIKKGSASINPILGGVILQFVAAILGCILLSCVVIYNNKMSNNPDIHLTGDDDMMNGDDDADEYVLIWDWIGVRWAILAGVAVGAAEMISFCVSGMGVQAMQSIPIIIGGSVMFGTVLGWACLGETLTMRGWSGVLMISIGISLVGMDEEGEGI